MKHLLLISIFVFTMLINNGHALSLNTKFEFSDANHRIVTKGKLYKVDLLILEPINLYTKRSNTPVDAFRNFYLAYNSNNYNWLKENSIGNFKNFKSVVSDYKKIFNNREKLFYFKGFTLYKDYTIIIFTPKNSNMSHIFILKKDESGAYKQSLDFKDLFGNIYELFAKSFSGDIKMSTSKI